MSHSTLYKVYKSKASEFNTYGNGWGSGVPIWKLLTEQYLNKEYSTFADMEPLWNLYSDKDIPIHRRFALLFTFDNCIIDKNLLEKCSEYCKEIHEDILKNTDWDWSHWEDIGNDLKKLSLLTDKRLKGAGLGCTSVSDPWYEYPKKEAFFISEDL